jgi:hypothetical protein
MSGNSSALLDRYAVLMRVLGVLYLVSGLVFLFLPSQFFYFLNFVPKVFAILEPMPEPSRGFWTALAVGLAFNLAITSFLSAGRPALRPLAWLHLATKLCTALAFAYLFFIGDSPYFAYAAGMAVEILVALLLLWYFARVGYVLRRPAPTPEAVSP